jgi:hypothetical protein
MIMNYSLIYIVITVSLLAGLGCVEKKSRLWIDPPPGFEDSEKNSQKLYYQVEDMQSGKKENLIIPLSHMPENLVVSADGKEAFKSDAQLASATKADRMISDGKLADSQNVETPTLSYLKGLTEVEDLHQKRQFTEALVRVAPLIEQYPRQPRLLIMQGTLFRKIGEKKLALEAYRRAQKLDPKNPALEEAVLRGMEESGGNL